MANPGQVLPGGFGSTTAPNVGVWATSNAPPGLNHSGATWLGGVLAEANVTVTAPLPPKEKNWPALLFLVIIALTVGGNILVIIAVSLEKKLQNATNFFLRSLAVADMLVGILVMPVSLINILYDYAWPLHNAVCPIWIYLDVLFSTASIMHLCAISLDRYVAIRNPIEHSRFNSRTKAMMKIAAVWTISIGVSMPIPVIGLLNEEKVFDGVHRDKCVLNEGSFRLIGSFVSFFIPLVIMVGTYCLTIKVLQKQATVFLCEARSSSQQPLNQSASSSTLHPPASSTLLLPQISTTPPIPDSNEPQAPPLQSRRNTLGCLMVVDVEAGAAASPGATADSLSVIPCPEAASQMSSPAAGRGDPAGCHGRRGMMQAIKNERRASKVLGIVFFLFLVMWCPFFLTNVTSVLCHEACNQALLTDLLNVFVWVGYISSGVNPLVYTLFNRTYRRAFARYIRCRYRADGVGHGNSRAATVTTTTTALPQCPSHGVTPLMGGGRGKAGVDRNSNNCRNGAGGRNGRPRLALDLEDATDDSAVLLAAAMAKAAAAAVASETEAEPETERDLSIISCSPASTEHTSSV